MTNSAASWNYANFHNYRCRGDYASSTFSGVRYADRDLVELIGSLDKDSLVHLFCNDAVESIDICQQLGLRHWGVDFSSVAVERARRNNTLLTRSSTILCDTVENFLVNSSPLSDSLVLMTPGSIWWIEDLVSYFQLLRRVMASGSLLVINDFHPLIHALDEELRLANQYPFMSMRREHDSGVEPYEVCEEYFITPDRIFSDMEVAANPYPVVDWLHSTSDIICALIASGFRIDSFAEHPYIFRERYLKGLVHDGAGRFTWPILAHLPLTMTIVAS